MSPGPLTVPRRCHSYYPLCSDLQTSAKARLCPMGFGLRTPAKTRPYLVAASSPVGSGWSSAVQCYQTVCQYEHSIIDMPHAQWALGFARPRSTALSRRCISSSPIRGVRCEWASERAAWRRTFVAKKNRCMKDGIGGLGIASRGRCENSSPPLALRFPLIQRGVYSMSRQYI